MKVTIWQLEVDAIDAAKLSQAKAQLCWLAQFALFQPEKTQLIKQAQWRIVINICISYKAHS